jgi:hypothetical protein
MSVSLDSRGTILLEGACVNEDAEALVQLFLSNSGAIVDWRGCTSAHSAVVQVLLAAGTTPQGPASGTHLARWVEPVLRSASPATLPALLK